MKIVNIAPPLPNSLALTKAEADKIMSMPMEESEKFNGKTEPEIKLILVEEEIERLNNMKKYLKKYLEGRG